MPHVFRLLHLAAMASWLGAGLWLAGDATRSLAAGKAEARAFGGRALSALKLDRLAGAVTVLSGLALLHFGHVWPDVRPGLWIGMGLAVARAALTDAALLPAVRRIQSRLEAGEEPGALRPVAGRLAMLSGVGHLLWLGALAGMALPY